MNKNIKKNITILGSTGSIGTQTLEVISKYPKMFSVFALSAQNNADLLFKQCQFFIPRFAVIGEKHYAKLKEIFKTNKLKTTLLTGREALSEISCAREVNQVVAAIVGAAGLEPIHCAVKNGKDILLANKESLVMTGNILLDTAKKNGASILPIDSEHNAIFQCLPHNQGLRKESLDKAGVSKLLLTGSGGPFRETPINKLNKKTASQACNHPNWNMGKKISIDSATMMNKGLEYIEAKLLFNASNKQLDIVIHPQSIIHSLVQYKDGSSIAQIGYSDMKVPISHMLSYPYRINSGINDIDLTKYTLTFEPVDFKRYPCLKLAISLANNNIKTVIMNAANEIAVDGFLSEKIGFMQIYNVIEQCVSLEFDNINSINSIEDVLYIDKLARIFAKKIIEKYT